MAGLDGNRTTTERLLSYVLEDDPNKPHTSKLSRLSGHLIDSAREPYEKWSAGFVTDVERACRDAALTIESLQAENEKLRRVATLAEQLAALARPKGPRATNITDLDLAVANLNGALKMWKLS